MVMWYCDVNRERKNDKFFRTGRAGGAISSGVLLNMSVLFCVVRTHQTAFGLIWVEKLTARP